MAQKGYSSSAFWIRQVGLAIGLVVVAGVLIFLLENQDATPVPEAQKEEKSVSSGLSDFYRDFRMSANDPMDEEQGDFVLDTAGVDPQLDSKLEQMSSGIRPVDKRWEGEYKFRTFKEGNTLREAISNYAQEEGMQLIWNLEQDFVIKHQFQMDNSVAGSLAKIANAIDSNFEGDVKAYLCAGQRSLVVSAEETEFLKNECSVLRR